jgi:hypothetical protein
MSEVEKSLLSEMLQWYRLQRHDYLNHWQVIMGNLQLNRPEEALQYMREKVAGSQEEQKIGHLAEPYLAAILLGLLIRLSQEGITVTIDFPEEMKQQEFWQDHWQEEYVERLYGYTTECMKASARFPMSKDLQAEVYLFTEQGGLAGQFILSDEETVLFDEMVTLTRDLT